MLTQGNAVHLPFADGVFHCCVTSPPYWGLRDYGIDNQLGLEPTPDAYVANMVAVFREVRRVLRDDGTCWLNLGDSYAGSGKGREADGTHQLGGKQGTNGGTVIGLLDKTPCGDGLKPKDLVGIPWRVAFALQADGWWLRSDVIWHKPNPMPESVTDRPTKSHEYMFLLTKSARYFWDAEAVKEPSIEPVRAREKNNGESAVDTKSRGYDCNCGCNGSRNIRSVWTIPTQPYSGAHYATFPPALVEPCVKAGSREGDTVLDPFCGSGTVGEVCRGLRRRFVGVDLSAEYLARNAMPRSEQRTCQAAIAELPMFEGLEL
jgi:DNA modification methylase